MTSPGDILVVGAGIMGRAEGTGLLLDGRIDPGLALTRPDRFGPL